MDDVDPCGDVPAERRDTVRRFLDLAGDRWPLLVIATLDHGPQRYSGLRRILPGISQRMLTLTLRQLVKDGLITRAAFAEMPPRVEYTLTPLGKGFLGAAGPLIAWASAHH